VAQRGLNDDEEVGHSPIELEKLRNDWLKRTLFMCAARTQ
jgi:hypothetical protein